MLRLLVSTVAGLALVGCSALESENFDLASLTAFNSEQEVSSQECKVLMDNRSVNIRSTSGTTLELAAKTAKQASKWYLPAQALLWLPSVVTLHSMWEAPTSSQDLRQTLIL